MRAAWGCFSCFSCFSCFNFARGGFLTIGMMVDENRSFDCEKRSRGEQKDAAQIPQSLLSAPTAVCLSTARPSWSIRKTGSSTVRTKQRASAFMFSVKSRTRLSGTNSSRRSTSLRCFFRLAPFTCASSDKRVASLEARQGIPEKFNPPHAHISYNHATLLLKVLWRLYVFSFCNIKKKRRYFPTNPEVLLYYRRVHVHAKRNNRNRVVALPLRQPREIKHAQPSLPPFWLSHRAPRKWQCWTPPSSSRAAPRRTSTR